LISPDKHIELLAEHAGIRITNAINEMAAVVYIAEQIPRLFNVDLRVSVKLLQDIPENYLPLSTFKENHDKLTEEICFQYIEGKVKLIVEVKKCHA